MARSTRPKVVKKSKIEKIQEIYGKEKSQATLEDASRYLKSKGYDSLADFLVPAR